MADPDSTAVRAALWRAMHVLVDPPPHVLEDEVGFERFEDVIFDAEGGSLRDGFAVAQSAA